MRTTLNHHGRSEAGSIFAYFIILLVIVTAIVSMGALVSQTTNLTHRHNDMVEAMELAEGGAALACAEVERAYTNLAAAFLVNLAGNPAGAYTKNSGLSSAASNVYERTIALPFTNQVVKVQIWMTNLPTPAAATVIGICKVGKVTQSTSVQLQMAFGYGAAIISDNEGTKANGISKGVAQQGQVVLHGQKSSGPIWIDGNEGYSVLANGMVNHDVTAFFTSPGSISETNRGTVNQIPDYTAEGSTDQLFDFKRFIAVADLTPNGPSPDKNNHFKTLDSFLKVAKGSTTSKPLEGVIVVDIKSSEMKNDITPALVPNGINVRGTLVFNFAPDVDPTDKIVNTAAMNINPANLSGLVVTNPATYPSGYPPVYANPAKNPVNIDITSKGFQNFAVYDDLPALMYSIGILDIHGNANISGVMYTPSFVEIENKEDNQTQYFKGSIIGGGGVYVENKQNSRTVISYDKESLNLLATAATKGKRVNPLYWQ